MCRPAAWKAIHEVLSRFFPDGAMVAFVSDCVYYVLTDYLNPVGMKGEDFDKEHDHMETGR